MKERKLNRLQGYNYSSDNLYYVTSCVHNMVCCFGKITVGMPERTIHDLSVGGLLSNKEISKILKMELNKYGMIAEKQWYWLAEQYSYVMLHAFIVMPNHIHGIIEINHNKNKNSINFDVGTGRDLSLQSGDGDIPVRTGRDLSVQNQPLSNFSAKAVKIKSLSELMGAYKTTVSKQIHASGFIDFEWQRSFYEHIIRDEESYDNISDYIINNPKNWLADKYYKQA